MAMIKCAECGREISDRAAACPGCGAPPDAYTEPAWMPEEPRIEDAVELPLTIQAATHADGRVLEYDEPSRTFTLAGAVMSPAEVQAVDKQKQLAWTRMDVRDVMRKSVKRGIPMGALPVPSGPSMSDRTINFLDMVGDAAGAVQEATVPKSAAMICPHCQSQGTVRTKQVNQKKGISGGKATAAVLTGGFSILATGLSRKEKATQAHCTKCGNTWYF